MSTKQATVPKGGKQTKEIHTETHVRRTSPCTASLATRKGYAKNQGDVEKNSWTFQQSKPSADGTGKKYEYAPHGKIWKDTPFFTSSSGSKSKPDWLEFAEQHTHIKVKSGTGKKATEKTFGRSCVG